MDVLRPIHRGRRLAEVANLSPTEDTGEEVFNRRIEHFLTKPILFGRCTDEIRSPAMADYEFRHRTGRVLRNLQELNRGL